MERSWMHDPRLSGMDPKKLELLSSFAQKLSLAPPDRKLTALMELNQAAAQSGLAFRPEERDFLLAVLSEDMTPEDKKRIQLLRTLMNRPSS